MDYHGNKFTACYGSLIKFFRIWSHCFSKFQINQSLFSVTARHDIFWKWMQFLRVVFLKNQAKPFSCNKWHQGNTVGGCPVMDLSDSLEFLWTVPFYVDSKSGILWHLENLGNLDKSLIFKGNLGQPRKFLEKFWQIPRGLLIFFL